MAENIINRIFERLTELGIKKHGSISWLSEKTGYSKGLVSDSLSGKIPISERFIKLCAQALDVTEFWLKEGRAPDKQETWNIFVDDLQKAQMDLLWDKLNDTERDEVLKFATVTENKTEYTVSSKTPEDVRRLIDAYNCLDNEHKKHLLECFELMCLGFTQSRKKEGQGGGSASSNVA